jgi:hypothetical protein
MKIELRIHRTFQWERLKPDGPFLIGGPPPPLTLVATDTLQCCTDGTNWVDVPVVEAEKPPHPEPRNRFWARAS